MNTGKYILAGDIGGTNTRLALFEFENGQRFPKLSFEKNYDSKSLSSLEEALEQFLRPITDYRPVAAGFAIAGPIIKDSAKLTNLSWVVERSSLKKTLGLDNVFLLNDLEALGHSIPHLSEKELSTINPGQPVENGTIAVIAPGTGLGQSILIWTGSKYEVIATEGGHVDFAPTDDEQIELLRFLIKKWGRVSVERACSGSGIPNIYEYFKYSGIEEPKELREKMNMLKDPVPLIINAHSQYPICNKTLILFLKILAAECGNFALKTNCRGGLYLGGGIPPKLLPFFDNAFINVYSDKGRMGDLLKTFPIHVILETSASLIGASIYTFDMLSY